MEALITTTVTAIAISLVPVGTAMAGEPVHLEVSTPFDGTTATFTSDLAGCEAGTVADDDPSVLAGSRVFGVFNGFKQFTCESGETFTVRLQAKFDESGSSGTWAFVGGSHAGSGTLVGIPFEEGEGITDMYDGVLLP